MRLPPGWQKVRLGDVCRTFSGGTPSRTNPSFFGPGIPWIRSGDLNEGDIYSTESSLTKEGIDGSAAQVVEPDTNLIALYGATAGVVGRTRIRAAINQAVLAVVPRTDEVLPDFLHLLLQRIGIEAVKLVQGAQPNLNAGMIQGQLVPLPPRYEQATITKILGTWAEYLCKAEKSWCF